MFRYIFLSLWLFLVNSASVSAQSSEMLRQRIEQVLSARKAVAGVAIADSRGKEILSLNAARHYPMQSVFKLHIGLCVLAEVDKGRFKLDQKVEITKKEMLPDLYSPIRDKHPDGAVLTLAEIITHTVASSDNVGCEVLLRMLGGAQAVEKYFKSKGFKDIAIRYNEEEQQGNWDLQFFNWTTPSAANRVLHEYYTNSRRLLSPGSHAFLWKVMKETTTGAKRLKGLLPEGTVVAHKTGSSGTNKQGITAAVNDIGIVFLSNGEHFYISVFVTDSAENAETNEKMIADIAKAAWDYFSPQKK